MIRFRTKTDFRTVLFITLVTVCFFSGWVSAKAEFQAGASRMSIVPPIPSYMGGFFDRNVTFKGVHDEVYVRVLYLENETTRLVVIGSDLTAIAWELTEKVRQNLKEKLGLEKHQIMVSAAHNHSAPSVYEPGRLKKGDPAVLEFFVKQFTAATLEAYQNRKPAKAGFRAGQIKGMTSNRQQHNDFIDPQVGILRVEEKDTRNVIATLFNFTGHPVIIGSSNLFLSGEYPGVAERTVENILGGVGLFTQGATGDVTMKRSGDPFLEIERIGRTLAGEVIKESGFIEFDSNPALQSSSEMITCPARKIPPLEESLEKLEEMNKRIEAAQKENVSDNVIRGLKQKMQVPLYDKMLAEKIAEDGIKWKEEYQAEVQVMRIGGLILVAIPGEIFVEYGLEIRNRVKQLTGMNMVLVGYANDYLGYLITPRAKETGGYEAGISRLRSDSARQMTESAVKQALEINK